MHNSMLKFKLRISDLRNCWQPLATVGLHKIMFGWLKLMFQVDYLSMVVRGKTLTNARIYHVKKKLIKFELWISNLRNCWQLLVTIGLHKIVLMIEAQVSGRLFRAWQWEVRPWPMSESTIYEKKSHRCENSWYA